MLRSTLAGKVTTMSDMGDMYRDMREHRRTAKAQHDVTILGRANDLLGDQFTKLSHYHWRTTVAGYLFDYWPTTGAYRYRGRTEHAEPERLVEVLRKLRYNEERGARVKP